MMRIAWVSSLRSTPPIFRRRGNGAQRGGTENVLVDGSSVAFCQASSMQVVNRPLCVHDWSCCSRGQAWTKLDNRRGAGSPRTRGLQNKIAKPEKIEVNLSDYI